MQQRIKASELLKLKLENCNLKKIILERHIQDLTKIAQDSIDYEAFILKIKDQIEYFDVNSCDFVLKENVYNLDVPDGEKLLKEELQADKIEIEGNL